MNNARRLTRAVAATAAAALIVTGCGSDDEAEVDVVSTDETDEDDETDRADVEDDEPAETEVELPENTQDDIDATPDDGDDRDSGDPIGDGSEPTDADNAGERDDEGGDDARSSAWPDPIPVDVTHTEQGVLVFEIFEVRSSGSTTELDVRITNGHDSRDMRLMQRSGASGLQDDTGVDYALVPPPDNRDFRVPQGEVVEATMSFAGPLRPDATSLDLVINGHLEDQGGAFEAPFARVENILLTQD